MVAAYICWESRLATSYEVNSSFFEATTSKSLVKDDLELLIVSRPPKCSDDRCATPGIPASCGAEMGLWDLCLFRYELQ